MRNVGTQKGLTKCPPLDDYHQLHNAKVKGKGVSKLRLQFLNCAYFIEDFNNITDKCSTVEIKIRYH